MKKSTFYKFDSLESLIEQAYTPATYESNEALRRTKINMDDTGKNWYGMRFDEGPENLLKILKDGWPEGREKAKDKMPYIKLPKLRSVRRRRVIGPQGADIDMQRVYCGELDRAWSRAKRIQTSNPPRVHIVSNMSILADQNAEELLWRGASVYRLAEELMKAGYNTKITSLIYSKWCSSNTSGYDERGGLYITIKPYRSRVNPGALFAACSHPAVIRSLGFGARVSLAPFYVTAGIGVGEFEPPLEKITTKDERVVYLPRSVASQKHAVDWLQQAVADLEG